MEGEGLKFETADELTKFLTDLQGQIVNLEETINKLQPVAEDEATEETEESTGSGEETEEEEISEEELSEIDQLLQQK